MWTRFIKWLAARHIRDSFEKGYEAGRAHNLKYPISEYERKINDHS